MAANVTATQMADPLLAGFGSTAFLLDTYIPGYSVISGVLGGALGLDVSKVVPLLALYFALSKAFDYFYYLLRDRVFAYFFCSLLITSELDVYYNVNRWLAEKKDVGKSSPDIVAKSNRRPDGSYIDPDREQAEMDRNGNKIKNRNRRQQEYEPRLEKSERFWHNGRLFFWYRTKTASPGGDYIMSRTVEARLYCLSRTTAPIKDLVEEAAAYQEVKNAGLTKIYRPCSVKQRAYGDIHWRSIAGRPSRPMNTVIMDKQKKSNLVKDIEQYLLPATRKWYAQRGIPYRRGYLFYGPPGTGKTSLSFALAGLLDLQIYCVSLAEKSMTEDDLFELFDQLPGQCLVLLEDIDTAGLQKRDDKVIADQPEKDDTAESTGHKKAASASENMVSLSGLLNVIDGVASHEGRVLIMTTNDVSGLDQALLRPGRIDVQIKFGRSLQQDAQDLFIQTYMEYDGDCIDEKQAIPQALQALGEQFASKVPEAKFTPAEIQGYLLAWKNNKPEEAVANVDSWVDGKIVVEDTITRKANAI